VGIGHRPCHSNGFDRAIVAGAFATIVVEVEDLGSTAGAVGDQEAQIGSGGGVLGCCAIADASGDANVACADGLAASEVPGGALSALCAATAISESTRNTIARSMRKTSSLRRSRGCGQAEVIRSALFRTVMMHCK
jgi:hypothetical protein